ncbi:hypothetical protein JAAARDRAFT_48953 [Jaapia argillacea MUCL 33604]|uniref:Uncharacterized protein n=1 Tax=Jaapia argillacea MUCL 33604 TaxID=933084 RepID=A0A067PN61_9AGAM|nr:hypothetical protein JAAARDRAFT_48953 [Jaapia argillacea MUCL 33604]
MGDEAIFWQEKTGGKPISWVVGAKDIISEGFLGFSGAICDKDSGKAFQLEHHMLGLIWGDLLLQGNLDIDAIQEGFGAMIDQKWPFLHTLLLSHYNQMTKPAFIITLGCLPSSLVQFGKLESSWGDRSHPQSRFKWEDLLCGNIDQLELFDEQALKHDSIRLMSSDEFLASQGELSLSPFGPLPANFAMHSTISHPGSVKYDPVIARHRLTLCCLITAKFEVVTWVLKTFLTSSLLNWDNIDLCSQHLQSCINQVNKICQVSGLQSAINAVKVQLQQQEQVYTHLCCLHSRLTCDERAQDLACQGLDPDPDKICPFGMDLILPAFQAKFLGLKDGHDLQSLGISMGTDKKLHKC